MKNYFGHRDQRWGHTTYAQHGDDLMIVNIFEELLGIREFAWIDLGAHHPFHLSNTALAYKRGSRGINVEANPALLAELQDLRPNDINLNMGVDVTAGTKTFYMYGETSGRNTFSADEVKSLEGVLNVTKTIELPVLTVNDIVRRFCGNNWPDLLLTDIEGLDYAVLKSALFTERMVDGVKTFNAPKVIVTETRKSNAEAVKALLIDRCYFLYCRMGENLFFIRNDFKGVCYG